MPINTKSRAKGWIRGGGVNTTVDDSQRVANSIFKFINIKHFVTLIQELWNYFTYGLSLEVGIFALTIIITIARQF